MDKPDKRNGMANANAQRLQVMGEDKNAHKAENITITDVPKEIVRAPQTQPAFLGLSPRRNGDFEGLRSIYDDI